MRTVLRKELPKCDICGQMADVIYDMPYRGTHWANVCEACRPMATNPNSTLATKLVKGEKPTPRSYSPEEEEEWANGLSEEHLEEMMFDSVVECIDGCDVEPDGKCPHGCRSPFLILGII